MDIFFISNFLCWFFVMSANRRTFFLRSHIIISLIFVQFLKWGFLLKNQKVAHVLCRYDQFYAHLGQNDDSEVPKRIHRIDWPWAVPRTLSNSFLISLDISSSKTISYSKWVIIKLRNSERSKSYTWVHKISSAV